MKVEYLEKSQDGDLIRLFDFSEREVTEFKRLLDQLVDGEIKFLALHEHCNINPHDNCHLTFLPAEKDKGIERKGAGFECVLTKSSLSSISELVGSFAFSPAEGYEWLDETSNIALLISPERKW
jgi:hypothetical protein